MKRQAQSGFATYGVGGFTLRHAQQHSLCPGERQAGDLEGFYLVWCVKWSK